MGVPYTMEEYFQEAGRASWDGLPSEAIVYFNCYDVSKAKRGLQDTMIKFVKSTTECKREIILQHFGHSAPKRSDGGHSCCDHHRNICTCQLCKSKIKPVSEDVLPSTAPAASTVIVSKEQADLFRQKLLQCRNTLRSSRCCVGIVSISTGFSLELVDMAVNNIEHLDSVESILSLPPVFSEYNAKVIFDILQNVLGKVDVHME